MARIFISYARDGLTQASQVYRWLVEADHEVFFDRDRRNGIPVGEEWHRRLHDRLRWADVMVCVVTSEYLTSRWCAAEVEIAWSRGSRLIPLQAQPGVVDPSLESLQQINMARDPDAARVELVEALLTVDVAGGWGWPDGRSPFPGLPPFAIDQHRVFFGRDNEKKELAELLRSMAASAEGKVVLVAGPSGCGKSSLVRAGLLPVMAQEPGWWRLEPISPGTNPVAKLIRALATAARLLGLAWTEEYVRHQLTDRGLGNLADELLRAAPAGARRHLLVVVDQFEEVLTQTAPLERARFAELLHSALAGPVQVVATLRLEFLDQLLLDRTLAALSTHTYTLRPLPRAALHSVIEGPAQLAGIGVDEHLVARLVADTDSGEGLPLLAFTLAELADGLSRGGQLSAERYDKIGGVRGALTRRADEALTEAIKTGGRGPDDVITALLRLVTVDERGRPTRWRVPRDELPTPVVTELHAFVAQRLLITDTENGAVVIGVVHEAFLSAWPPLSQAIATNASALRARRAVEQAATGWDENGRPRERLWGGGQLAAAVTDTGARICLTNATPPGQPGPARWSPRRHQVLVTDRVDVSPTARDFLHAGIRQDRYRRRRLTTTLSMLLILALVAAGVAIYYQRDAQQRERIAIASQLITQADAIRDTDPRTALLLGIAAQRIHPGGKAEASLVNTLTTTRYAGTLTDHTAAVTSVALSQDRRMLATGDSNGTLILWDLADPARPRQSLAGHTSAVSSVAFAPDGRTLVSAGFDRTVILWNLTDPTRPQQLGSPLTGHTDAVSSVAFAPDGRTLATAGFDRTVILWDVTAPARPQQLGSPLTGHTDTVSSVAFAPDGRTLASAGFDRTVILWDVTDPTRPQQSRMPHTSAVNSVAFAPDGRTLATASDDSTAMLWNLADPARPQPFGPPLSGHSSRVTAVAFAPDGNTLATASDDSEVILWDLTAADPPQRVEAALTSHTSRVTAVAFAPGRLVTGSSDSEVILWDLTGRLQLPRLRGTLTGQSSPVYSVEFAPDGRTVDITGSDDTVIRQDPTDPTRHFPEQPSRPSTLVGPLALTADEKTMVTAGSVGEVILWYRTDRSQDWQLGKRLTTRHRSMVTAAAFFTDGRTLATASSDGSVILWDLTDRDPRPLGNPLIGHRREVTAGVFSADGRTLATASSDGSAILWDLTDRDQPRPLGKPLMTGHAGSVTSVALAPDGNLLATGGADATVMLWDLTELNQVRDQAIQRACAVTGSGLTSDDWNRYIPGLPYQSSC